MLKQIPDIFPVTNILDGKKVTGGSIEQAVKLAWLQYKLMRNILLEI